MGLFRRPSLSRMLGISAAKAKLSRQLGFSVTKASKGIFVPVFSPRRRRAPTAGRGCGLSMLRANGPTRQSAVVVGTATDPTAEIVRISARTIAFPSLCPCCLGPTDCKVSAPFRRPNGECKAWEFPYCSACLEYDRLLPMVADARDELEDTEDDAQAHVAEAKARVKSILAHLRNRKEALRRWSPPTLAGALAILVTCGVFLAAGGLLLSVWLLAAILAFTWVLSIPLVWLWPQLRSWRRQCHAAKVKANDEDLIDAEAEAPIVVDRAVRDASKAVAEAERRYHKARLAIHVVKTPGRLDVDRCPVEYLGWEGTIHTFAFGRSDYAAAFRAENARKIC